jgi:hypothetical protein
MRIGAVIMIVGAHDARNAASRLTVPVSDGKLPGQNPGRPAAVTMNASGRRRRQLTPALLGVG